MTLFQEYHIISHQKLQAHSHIKSYTTELYRASDNVTTSQCASICNSFTKYTHQVNDRTHITFLNLDRCKTMLENTIQGHVFEDAFGAICHVLIMYDT